MQSVQSLLGLPILEICCGTQIAETQEVVVSLEEKSVIGIVTQKEGWLTETKGILLRDIFRIGRDAITIYSDHVIRVLKLKDTREICLCGELFDKPVFTETGLNLGFITDLFFETTTGEVKSYELSDGLITDLLRGRMVMPLPAAQIINQERMIVPEAMSKMIRSETQ